MAKARFTITVVKEYVMNPDHYPDCETPSQMLAIDIASANEDTLYFIGGNAEFDINAELIAE